MSVNFIILSLSLFFMTSCACLGVGRSESKWFYTPSKAAKTWDKIEAKSMDRGVALALSKNTIMPNFSAPNGKGLAKAKYDVGSLNQSAVLALLDIEGIEKNPELFGMLISGRTDLLGQRLIDDKKLRNEVLLWGVACYKTRCTGEESFYVPTNNDKGYIPFIFGQTYSFGSLTLVTDHICDAQDRDCLRQ